MNPYPKQSNPWNQTSLYQSTAPQTNIDLRAKMDSILFGDRWHPPQGKPVVLRHMTGTCPCIKGGPGSLWNDENIGQVHRDPDPKCSICQGEGFVFTETTLAAWRSLADSPEEVIRQFEQRVPGITADTGFNFFFRYDTDISNLDKIWELDLTTSGGKPINTDLINRIQKYRIQRLVTYRADNARIEYLQAISEIESW